MGTTPTTVNKSAQTVDAIINSAIFDVAVNAAQKAAIAAVPFLGAPIISTLFNFVLKYFAGILYTSLAQAATIQVIKFETAEESKAYAEAEAALRAAHLTGDQNAIDRATANFKTQFQSLVHFDGSASA